MSDSLKLDLDPRKVVEGLQEIAKSGAELSEKMEESLGKRAPESVRKTEEAAEKGANKISTAFRNLGKRVKEDLKTAFDLGAVTQGLNFASKFNEGIKEVFDLEKAFDRLNTRLGLSSASLLDFKKNLGRAVASTGQKTEDILPGVETAAAKGGIKDPKQLAQIGKLLGQAKTITGEGVEGLSDDIVEILKSSGKQVNAKTFKETLDAIEGTRTAGAFKTGTDAAGAIKEMSPYAQKLGLNTRELGGLAAVASKSGEGGQNILRQIMEQGSTIGGQDVLNAQLPGLFKNGKLNINALKNVDTEKFGQYSQQVLEQTTGLKGANGADLKRFIDSVKEGSQQLDQVAQGSNETGAQFEKATQNLGFEFDKFKRNVVQSASELGDALSTAAHSLAHGDVAGAGAGLKSAGKSAWENKGTLAAAGAATLAVGILAGGGMRSLLGKVGGGVLAGKAAEAAGVQPVYVVNASEISGGGAASTATSIADKLGKVAGGGGALAALGTGALWTGGALAAGAVGYGIGTAADYVSGKGIDYLSGGKQKSIADVAYDFLNPDEIKAAVRDGVVEGSVKAKQGQTVQYTRPSEMGQDRGRGY